MSTSSSRRLLSAFTLLALLISAGVPAASAASPDPATTVLRTWTGGLGSGGANGSVRIEGLLNGRGSITLDASRLKANGTFPVRVYAGTCSSLGRIVTTITGPRAAADGSLQRTIALSSSRMNAIWSAARAGRIALRIGGYSWARCANLSFPVATRVVIAALGINLPVVRPPSHSSYPRCNVAEYMQALWQPGELGVTFIYAHARKGMFLPLLTESKKAGFGRLPGLIVKVYTSDSKIYTYRISQVKRHQVSIQSAVGAWTRRLWLQTSEGPRGTRQKLVLVATLASVEAASYTSSHPIARPVRCG